MAVFKFPREQKMLILSRLQQYVLEELDLEMGQLAAERLLNFVVEESTPIIYNQAIADARKTVSQRMASLEEDLYALEKWVPPVDGSGRQR